MMKLLLFLFLAIASGGSAQKTYMVVLGVAQDAGYPQADCQKKCCQPYWEGKADKQLVSCLGLVDEITNSFWLFDATPDFPAQLEILKKLLPTGELKGIFLTHAHIGHYTGLMYLGREAMGATKVPVYAMPKMETFLKENGPWSQLVKLKNISMVPMKNEQKVKLTTSISVTPFTVPHRDEFSETVGFEIENDTNSILFIPDIDKWEKWDKDIVKEIKENDAAYLDATFYKNGEIPSRDMGEIPHPFIEESMKTFALLSKEDKKKINFIHFNHTNPVMQPESQERKEVVKKEYSVASTGDKFFF